MDEEEVLEGELVEGEVEGEVEEQLSEQAQQLALAGLMSDEIDILTSQLPTVPHTNSTI